MPKSKHRRNGKTRPKSGAHVSSYELARVNRLTLIQERMRLLSGQEPIDLDGDSYDRWYEAAAAELIDEGLMQAQQLLG